MEQLVALGIEPGDHDSAAKSLAALKNELVEEKFTCEKSQTNVEALTRAVEELKRTIDQLTSWVPSLEY
jgi:predicted RNase H-like nuclease (RuvC/YqgF family)